MKIGLKTDAIITSLKNIWNTESLGVIKQKIIEPNEVDIAHNEIRDKVELTWKERYPVVPDNYTLVKKQYSQLKRLQKDPVMLDKYSKIMKDY